MRAYIDHILAILPFEPEVHKRLGGPACTYVGHPLAERVEHLRPNAAEASRRISSPPVLLMLPGSRIGEIRRLLGIFAEAIALVQQKVGSIEVIIPTVPHLVQEIREASTQWVWTPRIIADPADKEAAFRNATAALAKSGTVTLELALAGIPMIAAYKVSPLEYHTLGPVLRKRLSTVILTNLLLGENVVPELLQHSCTSEGLAAALVPLLEDSPERRRQLEAFSRLDTVMEIGRSTPAARAADIVLEVMGARHRRVIA
jgi:lipid-A-disaccharide synthase